MDEPIRPQEEAKWTTATIQAYYADHADRFAAPDMALPILDGEDVTHAVHLYGQSDYPVEVKSNIIRIAHKLNLQGYLPPDWKESDDTSEAKWTAATRKAYHDEHPENFAGPDMSFPIKDASDVRDAVRLHGHAANPAQIKANIIRIAKRLGFQSALPDDWTSGKDGQKESILPQNPSLTPQSDPTFTPKERIASFRTCWLEDNAISLNGRQYPQDIANALLADGQSRLADPDALPLVCFATHFDAENDQSRHITGKITRLWREASKLYAQIDVPDTQIGRDFASMVAKGYIKSQSLRASGVTLQATRGKTLPQVIPAAGEKVRLLGIDFTTMPGLADTARIDNVILEAEIAGNFSDTFAVDVQETTMTTKSTIIQEEVIPQIASGVSQGVDDSPTQSDYAKRMMTLPPVEDPNANVGNVPYREALQQTHNHAASILSLGCAPGSQEAGNTLNKGNKARLADIHDTVARSLNLSCQEAGKNMMTKSAPKPPPDDDGDNDDDNMESQSRSQKMVYLTPPSKTQIQENTQMTQEEMVEALKKVGFSVQAPKTREQLLKEEFEQRLLQQQEVAEGRFEARLTEKLQEQSNQFQEQQARFEDQQKTMMEAILSLKNATEPHEPPKRRSLVETASQNEVMARRNGTLLETLKPEDVEKLAYRYEPLPESMRTDKGIENAIKEFGQLLGYQIDEKWGIQSNPL